MKFLILIACIMVTSLWSGETTKKGPNSVGPDSPVVVGTIIKADDKTIEVRQQDFKRKLTISPKSKIVFVSFLGREEELKSGYSIKAKVKDQIIRTVYITLPVEKPVKNCSDFIKLSIKEIFSKSDLNDDGKIDYVEFSSCISYSPKHGPDGFFKNDSDKSGAFDFNEFKNKLEKTSWWKYSRKAPLEYFADVDKDKSGSLSKKEFEIIVGKGHLDSRFKRTDKDKNNELNKEEFSEYIYKVTNASEPE